MRGTPAMSVSALVFLSLLGSALSGADCPDGKCDGEKSCAEKFGATYEILVDEPPKKRDGEVTLKVSYESVCPAGSATFTAKVMEPHKGDEERAEGGTKMLDEQKVLYVHRAEAHCASPSPFASKVVEVVSTKLPVAVDVTVGDKAPLGAGTDTFEFIAFPPGGVYDMMKL